MTLIIRKQFDRYLSKEALAKREPEKMYEVIEGESKTIPNDAMTIQEIMERAMKGQEPEYKQVSYNPVSHMDEITSLFGPSFDLSDLDVIRSRAEELAIAVNNARENAGSERVEILDESIEDVEPIDTVE
jgi:hypothetical protein